jgi:hypothetical protein
LSKSETKIHKSFSEERRRSAVLQTTLAGTRADRLDEKTRTMSHYAPAVLKDLFHAEIDTRILLKELIGEVIRVQHFVKNETAASYLQYGVIRRLFILSRTFDRIFELYPPDRSSPLGNDDRTDLEINLHAFMIHIHGITDNLALVVGPGT